MEKFTPGQRWYSDNEPELGLGIVQDVELRQVRLHYPLVGEDRIYRLQDAPLTRIRFLPHDRISDTQGQLLYVTSIEEADGLLTYHGHDEDEHPRQLTETQLHARLRLSRPQDRLLNGHIDSNRLYQLRQITRERQGELLPDPARGLYGCRIDLIPHQLYIAHEVAKRPAPRVLLADEVGLGKTIEAGLILHKQLLDEQVSRALILVPETLLHQWLVEMLRRFNLRFSLLDEERCEALDNDSNDNPFESEQLVLCSLDMFVDSETRRQQAIAASWDMLIVDEAHHLAWTPEQASPEYAFVEQLASRSPAVLLLTATPEQLGASGHFARLRLLDPDRFFDLQEFLNEEEFYQPIIAAANELLTDTPLSPESRDALHIALGEHPTFNDLLARAQLPDPDNPERERARRQLVHLLVDRHGTGRVLFRNTRAAISGFPERHLHYKALQLPDEYAAAYATNDFTNMQLPQLLTPERLWQQQATKPEQWLNFDPRVNQVIEIVRQYRGEKFLLICANRNTAQSLEKYLRERIGLRTSVFHEDMSIIERDRAAAHFSDPEFGAQLLICSEIGSEGRNFQFAHHLLLFDLPAHPDLLEQRIGRLDRIGQQQTVQIHTLIFERSPQQILYSLFHRVLDAFHYPASTGAAVFDRFANLLSELMSSVVYEDSLIEQMIAEASDYHRQLAQQLEQGRDRLLELNSYRRDEADYLLQATRRLDTDPRLGDYLEMACNQLGIELEPNDANSYVMHPGSHMLVEHFPGLPDEGLTLTLSRSVALAREDWQFLSWEHPLIRQMMERVIEDRHGNTALAIIRHDAYPTGTLLLECQYLLEGVAPRHLQLSRYLPPTPLRRVIDPQGQDCTRRCPVERLQPLATELDKTTRNRIIRARQEELRAMLERAEVLIQEPAREILDQAEQNMRQQFDNEISRLQHLATINPNVRDDEITQRIEQQSALSSYIKELQPLLDSVRIFIVG